MSLPSHLSLRIPETDLPRIVIIGGGFAGLNLAKRLYKADAQIVMLDRNNFHTFQPLLYQVATAGLEPDSIAGPLRKTFEGHDNYFFRMVRVTGVDQDRKVVKTLIGDLPYDYLVMANGSKTNFFNNETVRKNSLPLKRVVHALNMRSHILQMFEQAVLTEDPDESQALLNIVVVGGGPTGVEVCGALAELKKHVLPKDYPDLDISRMNIHLIEGTDKLLSSMSEKSSLEARKYIESLGIKVSTGVIVEDYIEEHAVLSNGEIIPTKSLIWAAGVMGNVPEGFTRDQVLRSRLVVDKYNRVIESDNIYAIGDIAQMPNKKYPNGFPMVAPVAIQQGKHLAKNLKRWLTGKDMIPFKYFDKGTMATIGRNKAVVDLPGGLHFRGFLAWLVWMFVHIMYLIGFRNKLITLNNWIWSYFTYDKGARLIIRVFDRKKNLEDEEKDLVAY